jgi:hypothetical protein
MYRFSGIFRDFSFLVGFDGNPDRFAVKMNLPTPTPLEDDSNQDDAIEVKSPFKRRRVKRRRPTDHTDPE